jgi:ATP-dependent Clp protease, protease subunit
MSAPVRAWVQKFDDVTVRRLERAIERAERAGQSVLPLYISSPGGSVMRCLAMVDLIDAAPMPVATIALGWADSCGAVLLACGAKGHRYVASNAEVMVHEMSSGAIGTMSNVEHDAAYLATLNKQWLGLLDKRTGRRPGYWLRRVRKTSHSDHYFTPNDVVKMRIADHVGVPRLQSDTALKLGNA